MMFGENRKDPIMKIALICPSNILFMPYVSNYENIFKANKTDYTIINWDRCHIEDDNHFTYRDKKKGHQRNFYDYYKYKRFVIQKLKEFHFNKVIVFGLQMSFFMNKFLMKNYKENYSIDIRDHNKIIDYVKMKRFIEGSSLNVISSPAFERFLIESGEYVINHNTQIESLKELAGDRTHFLDEKIKIACIGALRDYDVNIAFINILKNNQNYDLLYHGEGMINQAIQNLIQNEGIRNVILTGRYEKKQEKELYENCHIVNVLQYSHEMNNQTLLPNRLYHSAKYKKPLVTLSGSYMAEQIKKYNLGLVIESLEGLEDKIYNYLYEFNHDLYEKGVNDFFKKIISDNQIFKKRLIEFCSN